MTNIPLPVGSVGSESGSGFSVQQHRLSVPLGTGPGVQAASWETAPQDSGPTGTRVDEVFT